MLQKSTLKFLKDLRENNNKPWFEKHRPDFENAKNDFTHLVEEILKRIVLFDPAVGDLKAKETTFRQNRDIRFSKDKRPYKINMGAYINPGGKKINTPGYYLHIEPGNSMVAGGLYEPESNLLARTRQEIDYNVTEWNSILTSKDFKKAFPTGLDQRDILKRLPKGYESDNPVIEFLKLKSFTVSRHLTDEELCSTSLIPLLMKSYKALHPMLQFLQHAYE